MATRSGEYIVAAIRRRARGRVGIARRQCVRVDVAGEVPVPEVGRSVFVIPPEAFKTKRTHVVILNDAAEIFGWLKTTGGLRKSRFKGIARTQLAAYLAGAAYNLLRLSRLSPGTG